MKKRVLLVIVTVMVIGTMTACGTKTEEVKASAAEEVVSEANSDYVTYEFDSFDGSHIVIDSLNILSQDKENNPLGTTRVPEEAEVIAPGRDYIYLEDADFYYVEDTVNSLVTVATKGASDSGTTGDGVYINDDYSISYTPGQFEVSEARGMVTLVYCNSDIEAKGSNEIIITKEEGTTVEDIITAIVGDDSMDNVSDGTLGADMVPVKNYVRTSESPVDSALTLVDQVMVMASGDNVITVEIIRTIGQDDETDMTVDGAFAYTLESFLIRQN